MVCNWIRFITALDPLLLSEHQSARCPCSRGESSMQTLVCQACAVALFSFEEGAKP